MSKYMTIVDETIDQKDTATEAASKDVVEFILEEALLSVFISLDKDCRRIGDFNTTDDLHQQYDQPSHLKDFEQIDHSQNQSVSNQESVLNSGENTDRLSCSTLAKENFEIIIDSFIKKEEKIKPANECTIISEEILADNELQIKNGQIHLEKNKIDKIISEPEKKEFIDKKDIKNEKIEIEYINEGKLNKIYIPLNQSNHTNIDCATEPESVEEKIRDSFEERKVKDEADELGKIDSKEDPERPFRPFTTEELRQSTLQIWENNNSSLVGKWEGDALAQSKDVIRLMEELSSVQAFPENIVDPSRPRAYAFAEEDIKKMTKAIEEISFTQSRTNSDDFDMTYYPDGQGDADLESKSLTKSKENIEKPHLEPKTHEEFYINSVSDSKFSDESRTDIVHEDQENQVFLSNGTELSNSIYSVTFGMQECFTTSLTSRENNVSQKNDIHNMNASLKTKLFDDYTSEEHRLQPKVTEEECLLKSSLYSESTIKINTSLKQEIHPNFSRDRTPEKISEIKENLPYTSYMLSKEDIRKTNEIFQTDSINLKEFQEGRNLCEEFFPESMSLSGNIGSLSGSKQDEFTLKNLELSSDLDLKSFQEKRSYIIKGSRSVNNTSEIISELTNSTQQGTVSLGKLNCENSNTYNILNRDSFFEEKNLKVPSVDTDSNAKEIGKQTETNDASSFLQELNSQFDEHESHFEMFQNDENFNSVAEKIPEFLEEALVCNDNAENSENLKEKVGTAKNWFYETLADRNQVSFNDFNSVLTQNKANANESNKSLNNAKETNNTKINKEPSVSPQTPFETKESPESLAESGFSENIVTSDVGTHKFKLHSQKMYFGVDYDPAGQGLNEFTLTESEETFIDLTESVIQIIEPPENSTDEDCDKISFSLLFDMPSLRHSPPQSDSKSESELSHEKNSASDNEIYTKKVYSGMTTIGPIKNFDYDPKDLTTPEIDYGKMTRITSSRQLAKDMSLFSSEVSAGLSVKIIEEDDFDEDESLNIEEDRIDRNSLVNRDIASLTKVQKVREVMSYQPKSEEDFEDEEALPKPRLDLKDVESMTDERYKVPDVSIPLLSFEIGDSRLEAGKELIESMGLVISGLTSPAYYDEEIEEENQGIQKNQSNLDDDCNKVVELSDKNVVHKQSSKILTKDTEGGTSIVRLEREKSKVEFAEQSDEKNEFDASLRIPNSSSVHENSFSHPKCSTLGGVFKKASNKIIRKDIDFLMRNSKSLPRDTNKIHPTDSIRSILDDCQSSASSMLKKSRSFLKNTQSIFKSISQSRMTSDRDLEHSASNNKLSPSDSDVSAIEKKFPVFLKKEDFAKAKNLIKCKVEKTLRNFDITNTTSCEPEVSSGERDLRISLRNEENLRVDRIENFKKLLHKSPLVYKSQFVKSQMSFQSEPPEPVEVALEFTTNNDQQNEEDFAKVPQLKGSTEKIVDETTEPQPQVDHKEICSQEKLKWVSSREKLHYSTNIESEPQQLDYIVLETIQGLPPSDLESPSSEKENLKLENNGNIKIEKENDLKKIEASNSLQIFIDDNRDVAPCFPEVDEEKTLMKTPSEGKIKAKKKKFTARFRSFWCSAFGRVKTPPKKGDLS